jgi:hypothetical protein
MLNTISRTWLIVGWLATLAVVIALSVVAGATLSTSALVLGVGLALAVVTMLLARGAPPQTVAEILHSVDENDGRQ